MITSITQFIFDISSFITRDCCGTWNPWIMHMYRLSNLTICVSYIVIPLILLYYWSVSKELKIRKCININRIMMELPQATRIYGIFILLCGIGHLEAVIAFKWPIYNLFSIWDAMTAAMSIIAMHYTVESGRRFVSWN